MREKPTDELSEQLYSIGTKELGKYLRDNKRYMADDGKAFYYYMKDMYLDKGVFLKDVYSYAGVSESYGEKILRMEKHSKDRDLIILFCLAGHFNCIETNRALKLYGVNELYPKNSRDACIISAINNRIFDLGRIDDILAEHGQIHLSREEL